tara:strand:+ start:527 stop:1501 length:975 start_codon:yes stop_codon:yes gene_type:complete
VNRLGLIIFLFFTLKLSLEINTAFAFGGNSFSGDDSAYSENQCRSEVACTYGNMPLQRQGSIMLRWYLNEKEQLSVKSDPGWCGAVAGMMALYGLKAHNPQIKWNSWPDEVPFKRIKKKNLHYGVWKTGKLFKTNFEKGGTYGHHAALGLQNIWDNLEGAKWKHYSNERYLPLWSTETLKQDILEKKHVSYVGISKEKVKIVRSLSPQIFYDDEIKKRYLDVGYFEVPVSREGGHALVINGYDGDHLILYDPWGRIYTAKASNYLYAVEKGFLSDKVISGSHRTRFTYGKKKKRNWMNFSHFIEHAGEFRFHNILMTKTNIGLR